MSKNNEMTEEELNNCSDTMLILLSLGNGNPGAYTVVSKLFEVVEKDETKRDLVLNLICVLLQKNITGSRLWYIYKNESSSNINNLININLENFTDEYFYEKFEKYI